MAINLLPEHEKTSTFIPFSLLLTINHVGWAQSNGRISGKIVDKFTQKPIEGVNVNLESTTKNWTNR